MDRQLEYHMHIDGTTPYRLCFLHASGDPIGPRRVWWTSLSAVSGAISPRNPHAGTLVGGGGARRERGRGGGASAPRGPAGRGGGATRAARQRRRGRAVGGYAERIGWRELRLRERQGGGGGLYSCFIFL